MIQPTPNSPPTLNYLRPLFHERQTFSRWWGIVFALLLLVGVSAVWATHRGYVAAGYVAGLVAACAVNVVLIGVTLIVRRTVVVDATGLHVRCFPFPGRSIDFDDIVKCKIAELGDFARTDPGPLSLFESLAYSPRSDRGVYIKLRDGTRLMIGSTRAPELGAAIMEAKSRAQSPAHG